MEAPPTVAAVILAAGQSRRFGTPKQLALLEGRPMLQHVIDVAVAAGLSPVMAVVPPWLDPAPVSGPVRLIPNSNPERGMSHSLRLGMQAIGPDIEGVVILLGDQPRVSVDDLRSLLAARGPRPLVALRADGRLAPPVLVERSHFSIVEEPSGDIGLRELLEAHPDWVTALEVLSHTPDVDTPEDLAGLTHP
jgi:molybdenum cofactor cytidylyltransferase